ncbi:8755_t:CDS:2 [Rhizophagus irregularis]|nr:8755_t:CDS:2 [Rhizophagus irregularis]
MDAKLNQLYNKRHSHSSHTSTVVIYTLLTLHPTSSLITETFSPTNVITTMISAEPMTRRLTMNLSQKGKSIIVNEDRRPNQIRRWSETTDGETKIEEECQEVINVTSLKDDDDDSSIGEGDSKGKSFSRRFSARKSFWK